VRGSAVLRVAR